MPASRRVGEAIRAGALSYDRARHLPGLIRIDPADIATVPPDLVLQRLERALRAERKKARAGHWTYDLNRHIALRQALAAERRRLGPG